MQSDARAKRDAFLGKIGSRAIIMGILNLTPDSFSDGGRFQSLDAALAQPYAAVMKMRGRQPRR